MAQKIIGIFVIAPIIIVMNYYGMYLTTFLLVFDPNHWRIYIVWGLFYKRISAAREQS